MTFRDEGLQACVLVLQYAATETGDPSLVAEAKALQESMASSWTPSFMTSRDADALAAKLAAQLGEDPRDRPDTGGNPYGVHNPVGSLADLAGGFDPSSREQHLKYDEGVGGMVDLAGEDIASSAKELGEAAAAAAKKAQAMTLYIVIGLALVVLILFRAEIKRVIG